ncbi:MAG: hypothetical protein LM591_02435 [Candidatus Korarchaeum sp.]|nr:hypothetical protein [Candidatus Korarchaeum sp.]
MSYAVYSMMGYGHFRAAYPLRDFSELIRADSYEGIPKKDKIIWSILSSGYSGITRSIELPIIGKLSFLTFDYFQRVPSFYPRRDLSRPNLALLIIYGLLKVGFGRDLIKRLSREPLPLISTYFIPAFMAEHYDYPGDIYCLVCDADIARTWAPLRPKASRIKYLAPTSRVAERLRDYGVRREIHVTGFPLPLELIGEDMIILKGDFSKRLVNLDPNGIFIDKYSSLLKEKLGGMPSSSDHPLTIMFSVGGAGVQARLGVALMRKLRDILAKGELKLLISVGVRSKLRDYYLHWMDRLGLRDRVGLIFSEDPESYIREFNSALRKSDILWTKPSELSFYAALGIPIIASEPVGSHEVSNLRFLIKGGYGMEQGDVRYLEQWFFDWLRSGYFAEKAIRGFLELEKLGALNVRRVVLQPF